MTPPLNALNGPGRIPNENLTPEQLRKREEKIEKLKSISNLIGGNDKRGGLNQRGGFPPGQMPPNMIPPNMMSKDGQLMGGQPQHEMMGGPMPPHFAGNQRPPHPHDPNLIIDGPPPPNHPMMMQHQQQQQQQQHGNYGPPPPHMNGPNYGHLQPPPPQQQQHMDKQQLEWNRMNDPFFKDKSRMYDGGTAQGPPPPYNPNPKHQKGSDGAKLQKAGQPEKFNTELIQNPKVGKPNLDEAGLYKGLQTTPSPQLMNYIEFEGQELIITKQLNLSYKGGTNPGDDQQQNEQSDVNNSQQVKEETLTDPFSTNPSELPNQQQQQQQQQNEDQSKLKLNMSHLDEPFYNSSPLNPNNNSNTVNSNYNNSSSPSSNPMNSASGNVSGGGANNPLNSMLQMTNSIKAPPYVAGTKSPGLMMNQNVNNFPPQTISPGFLIKNDGKMSTPPQMMPNMMMNNNENIIGHLGQGGSQMPPQMHHFNPHGGPPMSQLPPPPQMAPQQRRVMTPNQNEHNPTPPPSRTPPVKLTKKQQLEQDRQRQQQQQQQQQMQQMHHQQELHGGPMMPHPGMMRPGMMDGPMGSYPPKMMPNHHMMPPNHPGKSACSSCSRPDRLESNSCFRFKA